MRVSAKLGTACETTFVTRAVARHVAKRLSFSHNNLKIIENQVTPNLRNTYSKCIA